MGEPHGRGQERMTMDFGHLMYILNNSSRRMKRERPLKNIPACLISV